MPVGPASGGGGSTGDVKAGGAFVEISARDRLSAQLAGLLAKTRAFAASLSQLGKVTASAGLGALTPLAGLFGAGANRAAQIEDMAEQLGFSVEQMQRLKFAADAAGVSVEDVLRKPEKYAGLMGQATVLNADMIRQAATASRELAGAWINLQAALVPVVQTVGPLVSQFAKFAQQNGTLIRGLTLGAVALTGIGLAAALTGKVLTLVAGGVGLVSTAFTLLFSKVGLMLTGFGGLTAAILIFTASGRKLAGDLGTAFNRVGQTFGTMFGGIKDAVNAGDFEAAFRIFTKGIQVIWLDMISAMAKAFADFITSNLDRLTAIAAILGGIKGAGIGGRFGPLGALFGGLGGAGAGALAVDQLNKLVQDIANDQGLKDQKTAAEAELERLRKEAARKAGAPGPPENPHAIARRISATRGAFRLLGDASQQFGRNDSIDSKQLAQLVEIKKTLDKQTQLQIEALNGGRFK